MTIYYFLMVLSVAFAAVSQLLLKKDAARPAAGGALSPWVAASYALLFGATLLQVAALRGVGYKNAPVLGSLGYLFVTALGRAFLGEHITRRRFAGNLLILAGILIFYL